MNGQTIRQQIKNYAELSRLSNLPTCWTNVLVGSVLGSVGHALPWWRVIGASVGVSLLYAAGMAMNDAVDVGHDRETAPHRPIPSGRVSLRGAYLFTGIASAAGLGVLAMSGSMASGAGALLLIAIITYNLTHKRHTWSVLLMGACRGLVVLTAFAATIPVFHPRYTLDPDVWIALPWLGGTLAIYVTTLTLISRLEGSPKLLLWREVTPGLPILVTLQAVLALYYISLWAVAACLMMWAWLVRTQRLVFRQPPQTSRAVLAWLSGICLVDAYSLTLLGRPGIALVAAVCFMMTVWAHRSIRGT